MLKNTVSIISCVLFLSLIAVRGIQAQRAVDSLAASTWRTLAQVDYTRQFDEFLGFEIEVPHFRDEVRALEGKEVAIRGYIIPIEGYRSHKEFIFSAYPYNMCFFCGGAGPETVIEVESSEPIKYTAEPITIRGRLVLNDDDVNRLMYKLERVVLVR